jgi:hypothetical protein
MNLPCAPEFGKVHEQISDRCPKFVKGRNRALVSSLANFCFLVSCLPLMVLTDALASDLPSASIRPVQTTQKSGDLEITILASRPQLSAGSGFGLTADIKNTSEKAVILPATKTILIIPPELQGSNVRWFTGYYAFFPTEVTDDGNAFGGTLTLQPSRSYIVKWAWDRREQGTPTNPGNGAASQAFNFLPPFVHDLIDTISSELQFTFFSPGDYKVDVVARYHVQDDPEGKDQTVVQSALIHVNAPESVILLGAAMGGLLGHIISRLYRTADPISIGSLKLSNVGGFIGGALGSMMLAAIVTILLSRISESQFLVRININDFWGAIAVGFIASVSGISVLDRLIPSRSAEPVKPEEPAARGNLGGKPDTDLDHKDAIRALAHAIYEERQTSGSKGDQISDWVLAEKKLVPSTAEAPFERNGASAEKKPSQ